MPLETELAELTKAVKANTEALLAVLAASGNTSTSAPAAAPAKKQAKAAPAPAPSAPAPSAPVEPEPAPEVAAPAPEPAPEEISEETAPTKVAAPAPVVDDTPGVAPRVPDPEYPDAVEHVDVDEVYSEITKIVKDKISKASDVAAMKQKWFDSIAKLGVEKAADLKSQPAKLQTALKLAKAL